MHKTLPKVIIAVVFLILIIGLGLIADVDRYDNNVPEERTRSIFSRSQWTNPFSIKLTAINIVYLIIMLISAILLSTLIILSLLSWKWVAVLLTMLSLALLVLIIPGDFQLLIFGDNNDSQQVESPEFEGILEYIEEEEELEPIEPVMDEGIESVEPKLGENEIPFSQEDREEEDVDDDYYQPPIEDRRITVDNSIFIIGGLLMIVFIAGSYIISQIIIKRKQRKEGMTEEEISKETAEKFSRNIGLTIDALKEEGDPRQMVILAYNIFIEKMGDINFFKISSETPFEFAGRVLKGFMVRKDDIETLITLFEKAKYSQNPVSEDEKILIIRILYKINKDIIEKYKLMKDDSSEVVEHVGI